MKETESQLYQAIKQGNYQALEKVYILFREDFFKWASGRYSANRHDLEDVWQETIIAFFENVKNGKLQVLNSKMNTYLFSIGKNILLNKLRKTQRVDLPGMIPELSEQDQEVFYYTDSREEETLLKVHFEKLGAKCKELLIQRYYLGHTIDNIRIASGLNNNNVVSASLSRCLNQLKDLFKNKRNSDEQ